MIVLTGKGVVNAIATGRLLFYKKESYSINRIFVTNTQEEVLRYQEAKDQAVRQLKDLYDHALNEVQRETAMIFQAHQMMLEDLDFNEYVIKTIRTQNANAEFAVDAAGTFFFNQFSNMKNTYLQERAADIQDVSERLLSVLTQKKCCMCASNQVSIIAADDLVPSETVQLDRKKVLGFITAKGTENSHTAILAKDMNIPAVVGMGAQLKQEYDGMIAIVDGYTGNVYLEPDEETIVLMENKKKCEDQMKAELNSVKGKLSQTKDGQEIKLLANIANPADVDNVLENDASGIGLMRSEFLYLSGTALPTEEIQFQAYKYVVQKMDGRPVTIRTMDIGADKKADYFGLPEEENPALGYRAIRICLEEPEIFKTQLRAIYRASAFGQVSILYPMITSVDEVDRIQNIAEQVRKELAAQSIQFDRNVKVGLMIETPAAAIISDMLAERVNFFSIGTNDLVQYTLAVDRQNPKLRWYHNSNHPAVMRLIQKVVENAHKKGITVGICGELAADVGMTETLLRMGVDELSMTPSRVLHVRKRVREIDMRKVSSTQIQEWDWETPTPQLFINQY